MTERGGGSGGVQRERNDNTDGDQGGNAGREEDREMGMEGV